MLEPARSPGVGINRSTDRRIAFGGLLVAAVYLALATASILLPQPLRIGAWAPVHLALAGAATTAIAALLPFFSAALSISPPARPAIRIGGILGVSAGALMAIEAYAHAAGQAIPAAIAGGTFVIGLGLVGLAAFLPIRSAVGPRRPLVERAYGLALANVAVGVTIATLFVGGNLAVGTEWGRLKPAHAWLNLIGFASLVIVATLLHLAPTIAGSRIRSRDSGRIAVLGLAFGAPVVAVGYLANQNLIAQVGALAVLAGAFGVAVHGLAIHFDRSRGLWTTDPGWHRMATGSFVLGQIWFGTGLAIAAGRVLAFGVKPEGWSLLLIIGPLVIGGVIQILVGAMTHLLPTIGPGDPARHARQRRLLGRASIMRLGAVNVGAALVMLGFGPGLSVGLSTGEAAQGDLLVGLGLGCAAAGLVVTLALFAAVARPRQALVLIDYGASPTPRV